MKQFIVLLLVYLSAALVAAEVTIVNVVVDPAYATQHHTEQYKLLSTHIISRRGFPVSFTVTLSDDIPAGATLVAQPSLPKLHLTVVTTNGPVGSKSATLVLTAPDTAPVGNGTLTVTLGSSSFLLPHFWIILFNPYNQADDVYFPDQPKLAEYIQNDYGLVWRGSTNDHSSTNWFYGQFEAETLNTTMFALTQFPGDASDVRAVSRFLTFFSTYQQANRRGILWGNWGSNFGDGKAPWYWQGSDEVFRTYLSQGYLPVKYGQCWVFGGVLNSLLRSLGVPSRHLTTFESAHESPVNGKYSHEIVMVYNSNGKLIQRLGSIWNFHSWNDAWFNRPDLNGANGWQAVDATPQEQSGTPPVFQMGPAPLHSVKSFDDSAQWDTPFVISEVSAKIHNYVQRCDESGQNCNMEDLGIDTDQHAGTLILTNPIGNSSTSDITGDYKPLDHILLSRVPKKAKKMWRVSADGDDEVAVFIESTNERGFGEPIRVNAMFFGYNDTSDETVYADIHCYYTDYTGAIYSNFRNFSITAVLNAGNSNTYAWEHDISDFLYDLPVDTNFFFTLYAYVNSTGVILTDTASLSLKVPTLTVVAPQIVHVGVPAAFSVSFYNPLPVPLTNVVVKIRKIGMGADEQLPLADVAPGSPITISNRQLVAAASSVGPQAVLANLFCDQFDFLEGYAMLQVLP